LAPRRARTWGDAVDSLSRAPRVRTSDNQTKADPRRHDGTAAPANLVRSAVTQKERLGAMTSYEDIGDAVEEMIDRDATSKEIMAVLEIALPNEKAAIDHLLAALPHEAGERVLEAVLDRMVDNGDFIKCDDGQYTLPLTH
jgi:hypothetical protein